MTSQEQNLSAEQQDVGSCGRGAESESEPAPREAEEPAPVPAASVHASACGPMAAHFGAAGGFGATACCREMLERFMPGAAPAETEEARAATAAAGRCRKEA